MFHSNVDITMINSRLYIVGQCWKNRTEVFSERNNTDALRGYISTKFEKKALVCRFGPVDKIFDNEIIFDIPEYNINYVYKVAKGIHGWLKLDTKNIIIVEVKGNVQKFLYIVSCALKFSKFFISSTAACEYILNTRYKDTKKMTKTLVRFLNYFDNLNLAKAKMKCDSLKIKQVIVMRYPNFEENDLKPFFKLQAENSQNEIKNSKIIVDENYIIGQFEDAFITGDIVLKLYYSEKMKNLPIFEINLNTYFMHEALYRFQKEDVTFSMSDFIINTKIPSDFMVDIVFLEGKSEKKSLYDIDCSQTSCMKTLSQYLTGEADHFILKKLIKKGYNRIFCKIYLQINFTYDEIVEKLKGKIEEGGGLHAGNGKFRNKANCQIIFGLNETDEGNSVMCLGSNNLMSESRQHERFQYLKDYSFQESHILQLELIPEHIKISNPEDKPKKKSLFFKKSKNTKENTDVNDNELEQINIMVKRPIQWNTISDIASTVFEDLKTIEIPLDIEKFEEWFCEPVVNKSSEKFIARKSIIKDEQRLFLVSISLKTLEKKQIDIYDLDDIIYYKAFDLTYEDLQNIMRILPTESEMHTFVQYKTKSQGKNALRDLNPVEQILMINMESYELKKTISILMFERRFVDEQDHIERFLTKIKKVYYKILDSNELRTIIKVLLQFGNLVNFKYSKLKTRKNAKGFKIMSLESMSRYTGIKADNKLTTFIFVTLKKAQPDVFSIFDDMRDLKEIMTENTEPIKKNINTLMSDYNEALYKLNLIDEQEEIKSSLKIFLGFAHEKLKYLANAYKEIIVIASLIKRKFGEDEDVNINDILISLNGFLHKLEDEYKIHNI